MFLHRKRQTDFREQHQQQEHVRLELEEEVVVVVVGVVEESLQYEIDETVQLPLAMYVLS